MHDIICPHCGKAFKIDETGYADILKQVRDSDFERQLHERLELAEQDKRTAVELAETKVASGLQKAAMAKDAEIQDLKAKLDAGEVARKLAVTEALSRHSRLTGRSNMTISPLMKLLTIFCSPKPTPTPTTPARTLNAVRLMPAVSMTAMKPTASTV